MFPPEKSHKVLNILGILAIVASFALTVSFNALAGAGNKDVFNSTTGDLSDKYPLSFTPAGFTFSIWGIIYFWLAATMVLYLWSLFGKLYLNPEVVTPWYSYFFATNLLYNLAWIFVWDREQLVGASILLFLIAQTNIIAVGILANNIAKDEHVLKDENPKLYWAYVVLPMNGQGIYTTWTCIAGLINLGHCLVYEAGTDMETVSHICLGTLLAVVIVYFILENTVLDNYVRFLLTPYLVVIWASIGVFSKNNDDDTIADSTKSLVKAILGVACILLVIRIVIVVVRQLKWPLGRKGQEQDRFFVHTPKRVSPTGSIN